MCKATESVSPHWRAATNSTFGALLEQGTSDAPKGHTLLSPKHSYLSLPLILLLTCTVTQFLRTLHAKTTKAKNYKPPPGLTFLTIVGSLPEFCRKPQQTLAKLAKLHAPDIMLLKLGQSTTIIISSSNIAKEVLQTHELLFSGRTVTSIVSALGHHNYSLPFLPVSSLGLRRKKLQQLLSDMHTFSLTGEAVDAGRAAFKACFNFLSCTFVRSVRNDEYKDTVSALLKLTGTTNVVDIFPMLKILDPQGLQRNTTNYITKLFHHLDRLIEKGLKLRNGGHYVTNNDMLATVLDIS